MAQTEKDECVMDVTNLEISRSMEPELKLPLDELKEYKLYNSEGDGYWFGDMHKSKKTIFIFIRHFLCFATKEYVEDLAMITKKSLDEVNVRMVLIGCGPYKYIEAFREATKFQGFIFVDPSRELYKKLGLFEKMPSLEKETSLKASKHVKSGFFMGTLKSMIRGMRYHEAQGDYYQQGGALIIGPGNTVHHIHRDRTPTDQEAINDLLGLANVAQVNYPGDTRVLSI